MKLKFLLLIAALASPSACNSNVTSSPSEEIQIKSIEIIKDTYSVDELEVLVNDSFNLSITANDALTPSISWSSADESVVTVDENGNVNVVGKGTTVITATVKDLPYISDSIFISAKNKVEQVGIGSGLSKNDPIFLGNEGEDEPIEVYFIEMQHIYADSIFIKKGNVEILIDAGYEYDGNFVNKVLTEHISDDRLDVLMVSHSDGDHVNGIANALKTVDNISLMVDYGGSESGGNVVNARNNYIPKGMKYYSAYDCINGISGASTRYYLTSEFYFDVLNTGNYITNDDRDGASNPNSLAVIFTYKDFTFFTAGDITSATEKDLLKNEDLPEVTLYKASHHGSHGSNTQELLDVLNPKAVAISAARAGQYNATPGGPSKNVTYNLNGASGHPAAAAIERIYKAPNISQNLNVYWNAVNGTMKFTSYGTDSFVFTGSATNRGYYDLTLTNGSAVWNETLNDFENKVTGEENFRLHETKVFQFRNYIQYLPQWAKDEYFPEY